MPRTTMRTLAAVAVLTAGLHAAAVPSEVNNLQFMKDPAPDSPECLIWEIADGTAHHVYRGDLAALPGDFGVCHVGSVPGNEIMVPEDPAPGQAFFFLVTSFDETGEGTAGFYDTTERFPTTPCIPARRIFGPVPDGNPGDGVEDGQYPLRNASTVSRESSGDKAEVYLHSGEFSLSASSLWIPGRGLDFSLTRTYRSQVNYNGPFGHNWHSNVNERLIPIGSDVLHVDGAGRSEMFGRIDTTHFGSPPGRYGVLHEEADGSFLLREPNGTVSTFHAFDFSNVQGALESIQDRNGNRVTFQYDHQGLLTTATDAMGRAIGFEYDDAGRITSVTDFAGRSVVHTYDAAGDLVAARSPIVTGTPNGNDFPAGKTTRYAYSSGFADARLNHCLLEVMWPNEGAAGPPAMEINYFTDTAPTFLQGRVESWTIGGTNASGIPAGGTMDFSYLSQNPGGDPSNLTLARRETTVVDRAGNQKLYVHNWPGNRISQTDFTNREVRPGEPDYTTLREFNADGEVVRVQHPDGNETLYTYDTTGLDRYREGNVLEVRRVADTFSSGGRGDGFGGESNDLVTTYEYEPVYNRIVRTVDPRGNDPTYVPQNGGSTSPARYTTHRFYDYEEGDPATNGINDLVATFEMDMTTARSNLGDLNNDGRVDQAGGNRVRIEAPTVTLDSSSNQAAIEGDTSQEIVTLHEYNDLGQLVATVDAEKNRKQSLYFPEAAPSGGTPTPAPPDGRTLDTVTGGYLQTHHIDTVSDPDRNNKTDPPPVHIHLDYEYDAVGNLIGRVDGRGVLDRYIVNALNQVVEIRSAAATADSSGPDGDPPTGRGENGLAAFGFKTQLEYDANDNVVARRDEDRDQDRGVGSFVDTTFVYDILDNTVTEQRELNATASLVTQLRYDANENRVQTIEPVGNTHQSIYDERDLLFTETQGATGPRGGTPSTLTWEYDGNRNAIRLDDPRGNPTDFDYDGHDRLVRNVDQVGNTTEQFYDPLSRVVRELDRGPVGGPTPPDRSGSTNVDLADTEYSYDELGRVTRVDRSLFVPVGSTPVRPPVANEGPLVPSDGAINDVVEYDRLSRRTFEIRDTTATTRYDYDGAGRTISTTDPDGSAAQYFYDDNDNLVETAATEISSNAAVPSELFLTTYLYDALDRRTTVVDNLGQATRYLYSSLDDPLTTTDPNGPPGGSINRRSPPFASVAVNGHGNVTHRGYDGLGRLVSAERILTANGRGNGTTSPSPDTTNPSNPDGMIRFENQWDDNSLLFASIDDNLNTSTYQYDNLDRRVMFTADDDTETTYAYDAIGNLTSRTDPNGTVATTTFDSANRATQVSVLRASGVGGTTLQTFEYDGLDRLTRSTDNNSPTATDDDVEIRTIYDSLSRTVEKVQRYGPLPTAERVLDYEWTADVLLTALTYPSALRVEYAYDSADRLTTVSDPARSETASFEWFATAGRRHTIHYGNGLRNTTLNDTGTVDIGYDGVRRVTSLRLLDSADNVVAGFEHSYDDAGNRLHELRLHHPDPTAGGVTGELWSFDSANRLIGVLEGPLNPVTLTFTAPPTDTQSWRLDGVGNWDRMTRNGVTYSFTPNNLNEYDELQSGGTRVDDGVPDDTFDDVNTPIADGQNRAHDRNGNTTADDGYTYTYDFRNRLVGVIRNADGAPIADYHYDPGDRRVFRRVTNRSFLNEERRYFIADSFSFAVEREMKESGEKGGTEDINIGIGELQECTFEEVAFGTGVPVRQIVHGDGTPLWQVRDDGSSQYIHRDPRGNVVALTEGTGTAGASPGDVLERYVYDVYGKPFFQDANNQNKTDPGGTFMAQSELDSDILHGGMTYDPETGNRGTNMNNDFGGYESGKSTYNRPDEGRWAQRDPDGDRARPVGGGTFNGPYTFMQHAPVNATGGGGGTHMPQTREHILLGRQVGVPAMSDPVPGIEHEDIGIVEPQEAKCVCITVWYPCGNAFCQKTVCGGQCGGGGGFDSLLGLMDEDSSSPSGEHDDLGVAPTSRKCVCVDMPYPCGDSVCTKLVCGGECGGGSKFDMIATQVHSTGIKPGIEHEDIGAPQTPLPGIEHDDIDAPKSTRGIEHEDIGGGGDPLPCVCVWMPKPCGNSICQDKVCGGSCRSGDGPKGVVIYMDIQESG